MIRQSNKKPTGASTLLTDVSIKHCWLVTKADKTVIRIPMVLYILGEWLKAKDKDGNQRLHKNKVIRLNGDAQRVSTILNHMILGHYVYLSGKDMMETEPASFEAEVANAFKTIC